MNETTKNARSVLSSAKMKVEKNKLESIYKYRKKVVFFFGGGFMCAKEFRGQGVMCRLFSISVDRAKEENL